MENLFAFYDQDPGPPVPDQSQQPDSCESDSCPHEEEEEELEEEDKFEEMEDLGLICADSEQSPSKPFQDDNNRLPPMPQSLSAPKRRGWPPFQLCTSEYHQKSPDKRRPQWRAASSSCTHPHQCYGLCDDRKRTESIHVFQSLLPAPSQNTSNTVQPRTPILTRGSAEQSSLPQFANASTTVRRRYNDFVWLHSELWKQYPGRFIPALPHPKNAIQNLLRLQPEFVEERRKALHHFLRRVAVHPVLSHSKTFRMFLEASGKDLVHTEEHDSIINTLAKWTPVHHDPELEQMWRTVDEFEAQLAALRKSVQKLGRHRQEFGSTLADLGWTLVGLGKHDHNKMSVEKSGESWEQTGRCCQRVASAAVTQNDEEAAQILGLIEEWDLVLSGAKEALRARAQAAAHYQRLTTNCDQIRDKATYVNKVEKKVREAKTVSDMLGQRVRAEMALMERHRRDDVKQMLIAFASLQRYHAAQTQAEWMGLLPLVGQAPSESEPASPDVEPPDTKLEAASSPRKLHGEAEDGSYCIQPQEAMPSKCG